VKLLDAKPFIPGTEIEALPLQCEIAALMLRLPAVLCKRIRSSYPRFGSLTALPQSWAGGIVEASCILQEIPPPVESLLLSDWESGRL
jgi:hypothetical protein